MRIKLLPLLYILACLSFPLSVVIALSIICIRTPVQVASSPTIQPTSTPTITAYPTNYYATNTPIFIDFITVTDTPYPVTIITQIPEIYFYYDTPLPQVTEFVYEPTIEYQATDIVYESTVEIFPTAIVVDDLDTTWDSVDSSGMPDGWASCTYPLPIPFVTWDMANRAAILQANRNNYEEISISSESIASIMTEGGGSFPTDGNIRLPENNVIMMLFPYYQNGLISICVDGYGKPSVYGEGINLFLSDLYNNYKE
jgi:hypothetical protein